MEYYRSFAARRYANYRRQNHVEALQRNIVSVLVQVIEAILKLLQNSKILRRQIVERIQVD